MGVGDFWQGGAPVLGCSSLQGVGAPAELEVGKDQEFTVKSKGAGGQGKVGAKITGPSRKAVPCTVEPGLSPENSLVRFIPREEGPYQVEVTYDGVPVPGSPFPVEAVPPTDPSKVGLGPLRRGALLLGVSRGPSLLAPWVCLQDGDPWYRGGGPKS